MSVVIITLLLVIIVLQLVMLYRHQQTCQQRDREKALQFNQFEAYHYLRDRLQLTRGIPYTTDWSAAPDFLKLIAGHVLQQRPAVIVECSSGTTSLVLARCCEINGSGELYSLENGAEYAEQSRHTLARYDLSSWGEIIHAPLIPYEIDGVTYQWYELDNLPDRSIDMLVIDGPPGFIQQHSRYAALPLLFDKLADGCTIFMDDAARPDEQAIARMWCEQYPQLNNHYLNTERGCALFRVER
ncbi:MAG: class I SAM-dependent methyltransferase [Chromatiales bacterium]|nr:class I SAM-dependent methyltransferase [Chromatiales bacterium]